MLKSGKLPEVRLKVGKPRPLTRSDVNSLALSPRTELTTPMKLRASHHNVARLVATGLRNNVITDQTGYTTARIEQLKKSPAFAELVARYKAMVDGEFVEEADAYFKTAFGNMIAAERHIADHLADADEMGELIPIKTALAISRDAADRFGYGKRQTNLNVNVDFAAKLEDAIRRSGKTIDSTSQSSGPSSTARMVEGTVTDAKGESPLPFLAPGASPSPPLAPAQGSSLRPLENPAPSFRRRA